VDEIASANGMSNKVTYLVYSHHDADHIGASSLFDRNVKRIGHGETRRLLLRDADPARPPNEETFQDLIHLPDHGALMLVDIVNPGWAPSTSRT
jgi:glyoxylase-like metal-dependent hydrolase (beta-lactamase superfamily II)